MTHYYRTALALVSFLALTVTVLAQGLDVLLLPEQETGDKPSRAVEWQDGMVSLGTVQVDPESRAVFARGWVNQTVGAIELLACGPGGKTHESVFVLKVNPLDLQTGLLLLGIKPGTPPRGLGSGRPQGPEILLWVDWVQDGETNSLRAEQFMFNTETRRPVRKTPWIFTGSVTEEGEFKALAEESLVVSYWDPWAIVNIPLKCGANDEILIVNTNTIPALNTPVVFRFHAR